jgi:ABC-2 type transport system permease protein
LASSSLTESQVIAFFVTLVVLVLLFTTSMYSGQIEPKGTWSRGLVTALEFMSWDARVNSMARGLVTTRDVIHFVSITALALMASFTALERRKWA